jgi:hypothetical protein
VAREIPEAAVAGLEILVPVRAAAAVRVVPVEVVARAVAVDLGILVPALVVAVGPAVAVVRAAQVARAVAVGPGILVPALVVAVDPAVVVGRVEVAGPVEPEAQLPELPRVPARLRSPQFPERSRPRL